MGGLKGSKGVAISANARHLREETNLESNR